MRVLITAAVAVAAGLTTTILCVAASLFYFVMQVRHLTPPITGTDAAYGVGLIGYVSISIVIGLSVGLFVFFKVDDFFRNRKMHTRRV